MPRALMCPQCNAPLSPSRFARVATCRHCGATVQLEEDVVSAAAFHEAFRVWNSPATHNAATWSAIGDSHWAIERRMAQGEISDVYAARRARWPTERVIFKVLRDRKYADLFENAWEAIQTLHGVSAPMADTFYRLLPQPVIHGTVRSGAFTGSDALVFRLESGIRYTLEDVRRVYPKGIQPRSSIWIWRRILEILHFIHSSGMTHGAILPPHVLLQDHEHGIRLVGFGCAGRIGEPLRVMDGRFDNFYPPTTKKVPLKLEPDLDLRASARCMVSILRGDPTTGDVPSTVPAALAAVIRRVAQGTPGGSAWTIREELGKVAEDTYGAPAFCPVEMPD